MVRTSAQLRDDAERIWWAGVREVQPERLIPQYVHVDGDRYVVGDEVVDSRSPPDRDRRCWKSVGRDGGRT